MVIYFIETNSYLPGKSYNSAGTSGIVLYEYFDTEINRTYFKPLLDILYNMKSGDIYEE